MIRLIAIGFSPNYKLVMGGAFLEAMYGASMVRDEGMAKTVATLVRASEFKDTSGSWSHRQLHRRWSYQ
ncbi:MAG: hypothetical protein U0231_19770 [Nitrospiraceae bacterium]